MITTITVTQQDIDAGEPCHSGNCPVARAISMVIKSEHYDTMVGSEFVWFSYKNHTANASPLISTPREVAQFIAYFDNPFSDNVKALPFTFSLDIPDHILRAA